MGKSQSNKELELFIEDVGCQIQYKPAIPIITRELYDHIEDRTEEYKAEGNEDEVSLHYAIQDLGDPSTIGLICLF